MEIGVGQEQLMICTELKEPVTVVCAFSIDCETSTQMSFTRKQSADLSIHVSGENYDVRVFDRADQVGKFSVEVVLFFL